MIYPGLDIDKCLVIPNNQNLREKVSTVWKAPQVYYSGAQKVRACIRSVVKSTQKAYLSESKDIMLKYYFVKNYSHPHDCTSVKILKYVVKLIKLLKIQVNYTYIYMCILYTTCRQIIGRGDYLIP